MTESTHPADAADLDETDVAIVGMAGRFPGADDVDELWRRVASGDDCLTTVAAADLIAAGVPLADVRSDDYIPRTGIMRDVAGFDPAFFGIGARDAAIMDPQHRHFLECAWSALEMSGNVPERFPGAIGVFGGCGANMYLLNNLLTNPDVLDQLGWFLLRHTGNDKDFLTNNVAYRLDLHGPAVNVQTACSTSLVAVHLAVQSLLSMECDLALAGGSTIDVPHGVGYTYREGEVLSADGVCRAFDAESSGTVLTSGTAVVALRRLVDAVDDGDPILAVVKGSAINNDGSRKVGFLAPSVDGHADVIREALEVSGVSARDVTLFEAHGTGTAVGDPIELTAVTDAYRTWTKDAGYCRVTSTKPNIGHLDTAAGTASLIKVVQALRHQVLPPMANHTAPSPLLDLDRSPFVLSGTAEPWPDDRIRRAGVSSLGVGGTNAHVIVEEAPTRPTLPPGDAQQVLPLSALTEAAVDDAAGELADWLDAHPDADLADVAHTLARGRRSLPVRRVVSATDRTDAIRLLREGDRYRSHVSTADPELQAQTIALFPGGGAQYAAMGAGLDHRFSVFHETRRRGLEITRDLGGVDVEPLLGPGGDDVALRKVSASLPAVFMTSVALARQWEAFGARPDQMVGHSLGEYVVAHLNGVFSLEDALVLVVERSRLMEELFAERAGGMLVVPLPDTEVLELIADDDRVSLATVNATDECVVAGERDAIEELAARLAEQDTPGTIVPVGAAGHSSMLDPILDDFHAAVSRIELREPEQRYPSNLTGTWVVPGQVTDPQYWVDHLRRTVRFADCLSTVLEEGPSIVTELGPGQSLSSYARRARPRPLDVVPVLRHPDHDVDDTAFTLHAVARLWAAGADVDLSAVGTPGRRTLTLPTYPFQHDRYWIEPGAARVAPSGLTTADEVAEPAIVRIDDLDHATWIPTWVDAGTPEPSVASNGSWLLVADHHDELTAGLADRLRGQGAEVEVTSSVDEVHDGLSGVVVVGAPRSTDGDDAFEESYRRWVVDGPEIVRALAGSGARIVAVTRGAWSPEQSAPQPSEALAAGIVSVAPREFDDLVTVQVDLDPDAAIDDSLLDAVVGEALAGSVDPESRVVMLRGGQRLRCDFRAQRLDRPEAATAFKMGGSYLVTGALGGVGHVLAQHLSETYHANLVVISSQDVPEGRDADRWLASHSIDDPTSRRIRRLQELRSYGHKTEVITADLTDPDSVRRALDESERRLGKLDGIVHAAGTTRDHLIALPDAAGDRAVIAPKALAGVVMVDVAVKRRVPQVVLVSSTSTAIAPDGQVNYVAANAVLDALAGTHGTTQVDTIGFGLWSGLGMASEASRRLRLGLSAGTPVTHPVLGELIEHPDGSAEVVGRLRTADHWVVDDHRTVDGIALLPGTGHLELMTSACRLAGREAGALDSVSFVEPLVVPDDRDVTVRVCISAGDQPRLTVESDAGGAQDWVVHSEATAAAASSIGEQRTMDEDLTRCSLDGVDPMERPRAGLTLGPRWDVEIDSHHGDGLSVCDLTLPEPFAAEAPFWSAHPALVDVATAVGVSVAHPADDGTVFVPVGYGHFEVAAPLPADLTVRAERNADATPELHRVDLVGTDADGRVVLRVDDLSMLPVTDQANLGALHGSAEPTIDPHASLVELADEFGLRPADGAELVERLVANPVSRAIGTTLDLDYLRVRDRALRAETESSGVPEQRHVGGASVEAALEQMWCDLLGTDTVANDADFFELGGHSLIAIRLMSRIHKELGVRLQLSTIFEAPTIDLLAARLRAERPSIDADLAGDEAPASAAVATSSTSTTMSNHLVPISSTGDGAPLFIVHGAGGNVLFLWSLARAMSGRRPIFGFQAHGIEGDDMPDPSIEAMAERYVTELRAAHSGPYLLGGFSGGGLVALEMVHQLQELGEEVEHIVLFDSPPARQANTPKWTRRKHLLQHAMNEGFGAVRPYVRMQLKETLSRVIPENADVSREHLSQDRALGYTDVGEHGFVNLYYYFSAAADRYEMKQYGVDTTLVKADQVWPAKPWDYNWSHYITGDLHVVNSSGDHHSMFYPENAPSLAAVLTDALDHAGV